MDAEGIRPSSCGVAGALSIYLGVASSAGKTSAMLNEGRWEKERGTDVVIGHVNHLVVRPRNAALVRGMEVVAPRKISHDGREFNEMDVDAVIVRRPEVCLVDELAHRNAPGSERDWRWQDVQALLDAGISVVSTLNVQHVESLNALAETITGLPYEKVPEDLVRSAERIALVDTSPEVIRRRIATANIYPQEMTETMLSEHLRPSSLEALRTLAKLWLADRSTAEIGDGAA